MLLHFYSPARDGPGLPIEEDAKEVSTESIADAPATLTAAIKSTAKTPAASVPSKARRVWTKVFTARSAVAVRNLMSNICSPFTVGRTTHLDNILRKNFLGVVRDTASFFAACLNNEIIKTKKSLDFVGKSKTII